MIVWWVISLLVLATVFAGFKEGEDEAAERKDRLENGNVEDLDHRKFTKERVSIGTAVWIVATAISTIHNWNLSVLIDGACYAALMPAVFSLSHRITFNMLSKLDRHYLSVGNWYDTQLLRRYWKLDADPKQRKRDHQAWYFGTKKNAPVLRYISAVHSAGRAADILETIVGAAAVALFLTINT